jgi:hypothetical protein
MNACFDLGESMWCASLKFAIKRANEMNAARAARTFKR